MLIFFSEEQGCHCGSRLQPQFALPSRTPRKATNPQSKTAALGNGLTRCKLMFQSVMVKTHRFTASPAPLPFLDLTEDGNGTLGSQMSTVLDDIVDLGSESEEDYSAIDALAFKLQATTM
jgi:hypothetical protein